MYNIYLLFNSYFSLSFPSSFSPPLSPSLPLSFSLSLSPSLFLPLPLSLSPPLSLTTVSEGQLVLLDAGVEYCGYVSDITRTWPVNGRFTAGQRDLYEAVLRVKEACIEVSSSLVFAIFPPLLSYCYQVCCCH